MVYYLIYEVDGKSVGGGEKQILSQAEDVNYSGPEMLCCGLQGRSLGCSIGKGSPFEQAVTVHGGSGDTAITSPSIHCSFADEGITKAP